MARRIYISLAIFFWGNTSASQKHLIHPKGALIFFKKVVKKITPFSFLKTPVTGVILNGLSSYHLRIETSLGDKNSPQHSLPVGCSLGFDVCVPNGPHPSHLSSPAKRPCQVDDEYKNNEIRA